MASTIVRHNVMPGKDDDSLSPYLRKPLRNYEDVTRKPANRPKPPDPKKDSTDPGGLGTSKHSPNPDVAKELAAIPELSRAVLVERWVAASGRLPPKGLSRRLLEYAAAWHLQSQAFGGLTPAVRRRLLRSTKPGEDGMLRAPRDVGSKRPPLGSRLFREWHGRTYTVDVLETGFLFDGEHYGSLSQVARAITGARWSGPRFFGL